MLNKPRALLALAGILIFSARPSVAASAPAPADIAYRGGKIYTVDARDRVEQALAIRAGRIIYVGSDTGLKPFIGKHTTLVELHGHAMLPGLVDGHMHPLQGGAVLLKCSLDYAPLSVEQMQARIQACLDKTDPKDGEAWFEVVNWFQEAMQPAGVVTNRAMLDVLKTTRPILVESSFGHTSLANSKALKLAGITAASVDPLGGRIARDNAGEPTGLLEDTAQEFVSKVMPAPTPADDIQSAQAALDALRKQGVTTFLDAAAEAPSLAAFAHLQHEGLLTARAHFALLISPPQGTHPLQAVAEVAALATRYDQGKLRPTPTISARNVKLFLDGVITAPAMTGALLEPYWTPPHGAAAGATDGAWVPGVTRGPDVYFPAPVLRTLLIDVAAAGFEPHMHADGDRAVREGLDGIAALRAKFPGRDIRAAIAHDEIVDPQDFPRYRQLNVIPVLSFQWEKQAPDTVDNARDYLGPERFRYMEPAGYLAQSGARIAYGSDWPVDRLDEWFALKVGVTRENAPSAGPQYRGRLSTDPGLSRPAALRAITMNASYELHQERVTGSLEAGKFADLIVLDRDFMTVPADEIASINVLQTLVGGRVVYEADDFLNRLR